MHQSQGAARPLLTALEVQDLLHIDRSTVYRMAEDGRLPAIRVGRSWRFPADRIDALLAAQGLAAPGAVATGTRSGTVPAPAAPSATAAPAPTSSSAVSPDIAQVAVEVAADLLGVMMVVTDMHGRPVTSVANPSRWFSAHAHEEGVLDRCITEWRDLADHPDLTPRFQQGALGFQCARAFIRTGSTLVGMVLAGGVSPSPDEAVDSDLCHLDQDQREQVLAALPRIAAAISQATPPPATSTVAASLTAAATPTAPNGAPTKEN